MWFIINTKRNLLVIGRYPLQGKKDKSYLVLQWDILLRVGAILVDIALVLWAPAKSMYIIKLMGILP